MSMSSPKTILLGLILSLATNAHAAKGTADELFRKQADLIPGEMIRLGESHFGNFEIAQLRLNIANVNWRVHEDGATVLAGSGGLRTFAINIPAEDLVVVNASEAHKLDSATVQLIALHESLMAIGYDDENYQITEVMFWMTEKREFKGPHADLIDQAMRSRLAAVRPPNAINHVYPDQRVTSYSGPESSSRTQQFASAGGGATSVGGGGDGPSVSLKATLIQMIASQRATINTLAPSLVRFSDVALINRVIDLAIEPMPVMSFRRADPIAIWSREGKLEFINLFWDSQPDQVQLLLSAIKLLGQKL